MSTKPTVLVLGALGFTGKNFILYLVENELASHIRAVDKLLFETVPLNEKQKEAFKKVEVFQKDLVDPKNIKAMFELEDGKTFDYVFNLAAETKYSQTAPVYEQRIFNLSVRNGQEAARRHVKVFVELSTAEVYESNKNHNKENSKINPWTTVAEYKYKAEEELKKIEGLNLVILRPAVIYGLSATMGLVPRLVCGRIYQYINEEMKLLWSKSLKINTVHVQDVSRAMWHIAEWYQANNKSGKGPLIYNLADSGDTDQEKINKLIGMLFNIKTGFHNLLPSQLVDLDDITEMSNQKHMKPWTELIIENNIKNTPLTPYLDKEILYNNDLSVDGTKICDETGFTYEIPEVTQEKLQEIIDDHIKLGLWPFKIEKKT